MKEALKSHIQKTMPNYLTTIGSPGGLMARETGHDGQWGEREGARAHRQKGKGQSSLLAINKS